MANINNTKKISLAEKVTYFTVFTGAGAVLESIKPGSASDSNTINLFESVIGGYLGVPFARTLFGKTWMDSTKNVSPYATAGLMLGQTLVKYLR